MSYFSYIQFMPLKQLNNIFMSSYNSTILTCIFGNPGLLRSHAMDHVVLISTLCLWNNSTIFLCLHITQQYLLIFVGNAGLLYSHALDCVRCMQIYLRLFKSILVDTKVFKNNMDTIENIDLENKATYLLINSNRCR